MAIDGLGKHFDEPDDGKDAPAVGPSQPQSPGRQEGDEPPHKSESATEGALENEPDVDYLNKMTAVASDPRAQSADTSLRSREPGMLASLPRMHAPLRATDMLAPLGAISRRAIGTAASLRPIGAPTPLRPIRPAAPEEISGTNKASQSVETHGQDPAHAKRNELFKSRWLEIKKSWESPDIDVDKMGELHKFEQLASKALPETLQNIADLLLFMQTMKNNPLVQMTGTFVEAASGGRIKKRTVEKIIRVAPHILHAMALSLDPDTKAMTAGGFRLALTPNRVEGDEAAGKRGLETKEVRLIRDSIRRALEKSGYNPNTGELIDKDRLKSIDEERVAAEGRQKRLFLEGLDAVSSEQKK